MSEHIVHTAVLEDCFNIMFHSNNLNDLFKKIINEYREFAQLASITRDGDKFTIKLLKKYKEKYSQDKDIGGAEAYLAYVFGWLTHRSADREMKPIWRGGNFETTQKPTECSVYHEAFIFNKYYSELDLYQRALMDDLLEGFSNSQAIKKDLFIKLTRGVLKRVLIEMHTFIPPEDNADDIEDWLDLLFFKSQKFKEDLIYRYSEAIINPDPHKVKLYIEDNNFYDDKDKINKLALKLRKDNNAITAEEIDEVLEDNPDSHYAKALQRACEYLLAANEFFLGAMDIEELKLSFDIGKPGRHGGSV
ncbi:MAG: hypothetical protein ACOCRO_08765 [Halanaerobiales bacterium]